MEYLTVKDAAQILSQNEETIRRKIRDNQIHAIQQVNGKKITYQIDPDELVSNGLASSERVYAYLEKKRAEAAAATYDNWDYAYDQNALARIIEEYEGQLAHGNYRGTIMALNDEYSKLMYLKSAAHSEINELTAKCGRLEENIRYLEFWEQQIGEHITELKKEHQDNATPSP